jgi:hypothetical protein
MWEVDLEQEKIVRDCVYLKFLKKYIEPKYIAKVSNVDTLDFQLKGIDFVICFKNKTIKSDLKAQTNNYINSPTPTFCFEMSYLKKGDLKKGWFLRDDLDTEQYILMWIYKADIIKSKGTSYIKDANDIHDFELMFIRKQSIENYLNKIGLTKEKIKQVDNYMRSRNITRLYYDISTLHLSHEKPRKKITFVLSFFLEEKPINIVISKTTLSKLAQAQYTIQGNKIDVFKECSSYTRNTIYV